MTVEIVFNPFPGIGPSSPPPSGDPDAVAYFDSTGASLTNDADLTAAPIDSFSRPQLRDNRDEAGTGAVLRQGSWTADGDSTNQESEGAVHYGPNEFGDFGGVPNEGGFARVKSSRFGLAEVVAGVNANSLFYYFRVDPTHFFMRDAANNLIAEIQRTAPYVSFFGELHIGGPTGPKVVSGNGNPNGVVSGSPGDMYLNTAGGAGTTLFVKESGVGTTAGWVGK